MAAERNVLKEGIIAGAIGATAVAVWFFVVDLVAGTPLHTPQLLGNAFFSLFGPTAGESAMLHVVGYTIFHYAAFAGVGLLASVLATVSEKVPGAIAGLLILFVAFEVGFYGVTSMLSYTQLLGQMAWWSIGAANLIAAALMGTYLYRRHPTLGTTLEYALSGRE